MRKDARIGRRAGMRVLMRRSRLSAHPRPRFPDKAAAMHGKITLLAAAMLALAACGQDATPPDATPQSLEGVARAPTEDVTREVDPSRIVSAPGSEALLSRAGGDPGYLVDSAGLALYYVDGSGAPCDDACEEVWPPVLSEDANHVTYHGHRLYRYAGDRGARTATGHDVKDKWGHWMLMGIDGKPATPPAGDTDAARQ
jgi:predicted lipoprotein with Yx(FWY)xxD motif